MTRHRSIASLLAAIAALLVTNLIVQGSRPAEAGGAAGVDPCPPDVDQDGLVGVTDLLQVLGAWGPCPSPPQIVGIATTRLSTDEMLMRVWSDGLAEYRVLHPSAVDGWVELPTNLDAPLSHPVAVAGNNNGSFFRQWADGTVDRISLSVNCDSKGCTVTVGTWGILEDIP